MANLSTAFQCEDAILQDDIIEKLESYVAAGGHVKTACDHLSGSYIGRPDALRAIVDWIIQSIDGEQYLVDSFQHQLLTHADAAIPRIDAALATQTEASALISKTLASPTWSNVLFKNAEQHHQSLFADRVFQETRLQDVGFTADLIGSAPKLMETVVEQVLAIFGAAEDPPEHEVNIAIRKIAALTTSNEFASFVVLQFMSQLEHLTTDLFLKRGYQYVEQEIRKELVHCVVAIGGLSERVAKQWIYRLLILADSSIYGQQLPEVFIDALMGILDVTPRIRLEKNIKMVTHLYGTLLGEPILTNIRGSILDFPDLRDDPIRKSLLIHALCHEEITDALLSLLFNSGSNKSNVVQANLKKRECLCLLVAYAKTFLPLEHDEIVRRLSNEETLAELNSRVRRTKRDLIHVVRVCEELKHGTIVSKFKMKAIDMFVAAIDDFITAKGILIWAEKSLRGGKDVRSLLVSATKYVSFLEGIALSHPCLRRAVLDVILTAYMREYSGLESANVDQLRTTLINSITSMTEFMAGSDIVYSIAERWLLDEEIEEEHFCRFITSLLRVVLPPYEPGFVSCLSEFLRNDRVSRAIKTDDAASSLVQAFELATSVQATP